MTGQCCAARRLSKGAAAILPAAIVALLPKCPLCLAAWLTAATGVGFSASGAAWVRAGVVALWIGALGVMAWRRLFEHKGEMVWQRAKRETCK
jgi:hypothetical protein